MCLIIGILLQLPGNCKGAWINKEVDFSDPQLFLDTLINADYQTVAPYVWNGSITRLTLMAGRKYKSERLKKTMSVTPIIPPTARELQRMSDIGIVNLRQRILSEGKSAFTSAAQEIAGQVIEEGNVKIRTAADLEDVGNYFDSKENEIIQAKGIQYFDLQKTIEKKLKLRKIDSLRLSLVRYLWPDQYGVYLKGFSHPHLVMAHTQLAKGGIDLTPANMRLQTRNSGGEIKFHLDPAMLKQLQNAPGFVPVVISIQPLTNLRIFLGLEVKQNAAVI